MTKPDTSTAAVAKLMDGVTENPWRVIHRDFDRESYIVADGKIISDEIDNEADAEFIAAARQLIPALLAERETLSEAIDGMLIALSTGKGIAEATDNAKAAMRRATQGKE